MTLKRTLAERDIALQLADFTNRDPVIHAELQRLNIQSIPPAVIYSPGAEPVILPDMVTEEQLLAALQTAVENLERR